MKESIKWDGAIWNQCMPLHLLTTMEQNYLFSWSLHEDPVVVDIWQEMDNAWDSFNLDNRLPLDNQPISKFYNHPVWVLNGIFTSYDQISRQHRKSIARKITELRVNRVADFGGGFGELARQISLVSPGIEVDIIEPFPSTISQYFIAKQSQTRLISRLEGAHFKKVGLSIGQKRY